MVVIILTVYAIIKRDWILAILCMGVLVQTVITTLAMPASYFKYFYEMYLFAYYFMVIVLLDEYLNKYDRMFFGEYKKQKRIDRIVYESNKNVLSEEVEVTEISRNRKTKTERQSQNTLTISMENIEYMISRLESINPERSKYYSEEYERALNSVDIMQNKRVSETSIISLEARLEFELMFTKGENTSLTEKLDELKKEYLSHFIEKTQEKTSITLDDLDKLMELFLKTKDSYSILEQRKILRNFATIYTLEVKENITNRLKREGYRYSDINDITSKLDPNALTIGFSRRFATYKRATLIFKDLERITQILNEAGKPVQIIFAGKAHPSDNGGKDLIRYIHELSMKPQFKGKIFLLENYNIGISKYLVSGVDVWLNNPRRPMEASGTSGQKAAVNGVINFSVLDGWWAEGYNQKNGWTIGTNAEYSSYEEQDNADSESIYQTLENKIIPTFFDKDENGISKRWMEIMKQSIISNAGRYSTARMLIDYTNKFYMPLCNLYNKYYTDLSSVAEFNSWKNNLYSNWNDITIKQEKGNLDNITVDAGNNITVRCKVYLPNIDKNSIEAQVYYGQIMENGIVDKIQIIPMNLIGSDDEKKEYEYEATVELTTGGNYGYTFRVMPKNEMLLDPANLDLVKWITK